MNTRLKICIGISILEHNLLPLLQKIVICVCVNYTNCINIIQITKTNTIEHRVSFSKIFHKSVLIEF